MTEDGVAGLSMASLARALSIQPPSLYKYFPSRMAIYDALFRLGQLANLETLRSGMHGAAPAARMIIVMNCSPSGRAPGLVARLSRSAGPAA